MNATSWTGNRGSHLALGLLGLTLLFPALPLHGEQPPTPATEAFDATVNAQSPAMTDTVNAPQETVDPPFLAPAAQNQSSWGENPCTSNNTYYLCHGGGGCSPGYECAYKCSLATGECCMVPPFPCIPETLCFS